MPSRNRLLNAAELVSRSLNWTNAPSRGERSAMVNALTPLIYARCRALEAPAYDEQIIARLGGGVQPQRDLWFLMVSGAVRKAAKSGAEGGQKRAAEKSAAFEVDNREASNR